MKFICITAERILVLMIILFNLSDTPVLSQSPATLINYSTRIIVRPGYFETVRSYVVQINDKSAENLSQIEIPFEKGDKLDILEAYSIDRNGEIIAKPGKKDILTSSNISEGTFYADLYKRTFSLHGNTYPYRIVYSYRIISSGFLAIARWTPLPYSNISTEEASLRIEIPYNYNIRISSSGDFIHTVDSLQKSYILRWVIKDVDPVAYEVFSPEIRELKPFVNIVPLDFTMGVRGSMADWQSFGQWNDLLNMDLLDLPVSDQLKVTEIVKGIADKHERIRRLYHYMQDNTRYINVKMDIGGLKSYPASYVSINKYGDCKALSTYMKALLFQAGIRSYYTLVNAGEERGYIDKDFPGQQFNHVILCVPLESDTIWLENTAGYVPFNYLGTFTQNRLGLLINGRNSTLVKIPEMELDDFLNETVYHITLNSQGSGNAVISKTMRGDEFVRYAAMKNVLGERDQKEELEKDLRLNNFESNEWIISQDDRDIPVIKITANLKLTNQVRKIGNSLILTSPPIESFQPDLPADRKNPVKVFYPVYRRDSVYYDFTAPDPYEIKLPGDVNIETAYGKYSSAYSLDGRRILIVRTFCLYSNCYKTTEYPEFYSFFDRINNSLRESSIILNKL